MNILTPTMLAMAHFGFTNRKSSFDFVASSILAVELFQHKCGKDGASKWVRGWIIPAETVPGKFIGIPIGKPAAIQSIPKRRQSPLSC